MYVIIGAGTAGLYTAIKLRKAGITDFKVYDPRAGEYTRPGHLTSGVFARAQKGTGTQFWPDTYGHIKDLERGLFAAAKALDITFEKKSFLRLHQDKHQPGVFVSDGITEEFIPCDYVFDCSGTQRGVIHSLNALCPTSPLKLKSVTTIPTPDRFLAYVHMSPADLALVNVHKGERVETMDPVDYARHLLRLRTFGWNEFQFPFCYGKSFGKKSDKACLYFDTPPGLTTQQHTAWFDTTLAGISPLISYTQVKPSRQFKHKPRFSPIKLSANALEQVAYQGADLPAVIGLGDVQIDPHFVLAHGIYNGLKRIDELFETLKIIDGKIFHFDAKEYQSSIAKKLKKHEAQLSLKSEAEKKCSIQALDIATLKLKQAVKNANGDEALAFAALLNEAKGRQNYYKTLKFFADCHHPSNKLAFEKFSIVWLFLMMSRLHSCALKAFNKLPTSFFTERQEVQEILLKLISSWSEFGNKFFQTGQISDSIVAYKKALEIFQLPTIQSLTPPEIILPVYSNLVIAQIRNNQYQEATINAQTALDLYYRASSSILPNNYETLMKELQLQIAKNSRSEQLQRFGMFPAAEHSGDTQQLYPPQTERSEADAGTAPRQ